MRPLLLALVFAALAPVARGEPGLKGGACSADADALAIARLAGKSAATGQVQTLRSTCGGQTRTYLVSEISSGSSTTLRVTEITSGGGHSVVRPGAKRDFNATSSAKLIRVPRD